MRATTTRAGVVVVVALEAGWFELRKRRHAWFYSLMIRPAAIRVCRYDLSRPACLIQLADSWHRSVSFSDKKCKKKNTCALQRKLTFNSCLVVVQINKL